MQTANPYAPPQAAVADIADAGDDGLQEVHIFAWRGRIGRLRYLAYYILVSLISGVLGAVLGATGAPSAVATLLVYAVSIGLMLMISIQRSHDMDYSGWTALLALIPFVSLVWLFKAGTPGRNRFGAPPVPNTTGVKLAALLIPAVAVLGIVAAIALPAYQAYTLKAKAKAAQMK